MSSGQGRHGQGLRRREFLRRALWLGAGSGVALSGLGCGRADPDEGAAPPVEPGWEAGQVAHLLPMADHERIVLKASFLRPLSGAPRLVAGSRVAPGVATDGAERFFRFDLRGLEPATEYSLSLVEGSGAPLCDPWPLRTFPAPGSEPERLRLLVYTCAGGPDDLYNFGFFDAYLPMAHRRRLLRRALAYRPDAAVANGDHVYWDLKSRFGWAMGRSPVAWWKAGLFDRDEPVLGGGNEAVLKRAFGPQIAGLYGGLLRSTPTYFLQDDHDYGENDEASEALRTFPPDPFMIDLARSTRRLYLPELPAGPDLPAGHRSPQGLSDHFGTLRFGRLLEAWLYDCRRHLENALDPALSHRASRFVPAEIEAWLAERSTTSPCLHSMHMPSTPVLWSAGKWGEWYPDAKDPEGVLRPDAEKPYWAPGWAAQHDRLLAAAASRSDRTPLFVSGDLHATAIGRIHASHGRAPGLHPVVSVLCGAVGTGALGWPSRFRGQIPVPSGTVQAEEMVAPIEENGFSLLDVTPDEVVVSQFRWTPERDPAEIDTLGPFSVVRLPRPGFRT